jgi:hypothetical protein
MVQDYVPARANLSTGLIVKSHILERNKYERYEPEVEITNNYSESIELLTVSGTDPDEIPWSTANKTFSQFTVQPLSNNTGSDNVYVPVEISNTYSWEKYTGEFGGSTLDVVTGNFSQIEASSMTNPGPYFISNCNRYSFTLEGSVSGTSYTGSYVDCSGAIQQISLSPIIDIPIDICSFNTEISIITIPTVGSEFLTEYYPIGPCSSSYELPTVFYNDGATYNNINKSVTSTRFTEAEYSYGIDIPVNMSSIISQSSCQNCNRINCYELIVSNPTVTTYAFTYQDCNNEVRYVALLPLEELLFCAKSNTLNFLYGAETYLNVIQGGICGSAFSNYPYVGNCKYISVCNSIGPATSSFSISYIDCTGVGRVRTVPNGSCSPLTCLDPDTLVIGSIFEPPIPPTDYTIEDLGFCNYPFPYTLSTEFTKYCDFFAQYELPIPFQPGVWSYEYQRCSDGLIVSASGVTPLSYEIISVNACIRSGTLITSGVIIPDIITGSLSYCGFYEDPTPYSGSRTPVEIQEYNYNRTSTLNSRYAGAKNSSAKYNVFTKGDQSYPGFASIDNYVGFTGLFTNVESSSYFPDQMTIKLSYLSDTSGGLNDLNLQNNNWVYVQNIYKPNSTVTIKQFNATEFSNQNYLDKQFKVFESGYSNQPYWYRSNSDTKECYRSEFAGSSGSNEFAYVNYRLDVSYMLNTNYPPTHSSTLVRSDFPYIPSGSSESDFSGSANTYQLSLHDKNQNRGGSNLVPYYYYSSSWNPNHKYSTGSYYNVPEDGIYNIKSRFYYRVFGYGTSSPGWDVKIYIIKNPSTASGYLDGGTILDVASYDRYNDEETRTRAEYTGFLEKDDRVFTKVVIEDWKRGVITQPTGPVPTYQHREILPQEFYNSYELVSALGNYCIEIDNNLLFSSSYIAGDKTLPLTTGMSVYFNVSGSTSFIPELSSSLYPLLGDINYTTEIEKGDYIILYYNKSDLGLGPGQLYPVSRRIIDIVDDGVTQRSIEVYPNMPAYITAANINLYQKAAFIKKQPDESSIILQGRKREGKTSYGFLVPQDINPYILQNINTLQSTIQSQILNF